MIRCPRGGAAVPALLLHNFCHLRVRHSPLLFFLSLAWIFPTAAERPRRKVSLYGRSRRRRPGLPLAGARTVMSARARMRGLIMPPRFLSFLPARLVFEAVTDKTDTLFQALQCGRDWRQLFGQAPPNQIRYHRQKRLSRVSPVRALCNRGSRLRLHGGEQRRQTICDLLFDGVQPLRERSEQVSRRWRWWRRLYSFRGT
jgi:hypothetical protein